MFLCFVLSFFLQCSLNEYIDLLLFTNSLKNSEWSMLIKFFNFSGLFVILYCKTGNKNNKHFRLKVIFKLGCTASITSIIFTVPYNPFRLHLQKIPQKNIYIYDVSFNKILFIILNFDKLLDIVFLLQTPTSSSVIILTSSFLFVFLW